MYQSLDLFQTAAAMARHAGARQAVVAANIANADTPEFVAQKTVSFDNVYNNPANSGLKTTRVGHRTIEPSAITSGVVTDTTTSPVSPNGNSVSIEEEMMNSVSISREHNRALTIYRHTMTVLRTALGRT